MGLFSLLGQVVTAPVKVVSEEYCQCRRWHFLPKQWDSVTKSGYSSLADHMPARLGGCTDLNHGSYPAQRNFQPLQVRP